MAKSKHPSVSLAHPESLLEPGLIRRKLTELHRLDPSFRVFGASRHRYLLASPLSPSELAEFEQRTGTSLPEEYRRFVCEVGNGGAGPGEGLFPLGYVNAGGNVFEPWLESLRFGVPGLPFPHREPWNLPPERLRPPAVLSENGREGGWLEEVEAAYWKPGVVDGVMPVAHHGSHLWSLLVVTGPERGRMWRDLREDRRGLQPEEDAAGEHLTFARWYRRWLQQALTEAGRRLAWP